MSDPLGALTDADMKRIADGIGVSMPKVIAFVKAARKLKLGARGGNVTLTSEECRGVIWALKLLKDREE